MATTAFFTENPLPVFDFLSTDSKRQLDAYLLDGNTAFRQKRLLEFFKTVDWMAADEPCDDRMLHKLSPPLRRQVVREIEDYRMQKAVQRVENAEKREEYRLRVFEYFRIKMPSADKALLESLRDYELDLTGRDVNWRHHFTLDSFKKIDAFIEAAPAERQELFARFKKDVDTYKKNYDKIHQAQYAQHREHSFTFDDWCDMMGDASPKPGAGRKTSGGHTTTVSANPVLKAYQTLGVTLGAAPDAVKKQYRRLTLQHHPDLASGPDKARAEEKMKAIVAAYHEIQRYWQQQVSG